jgi:ABC-type transport system substrate-binding protein
LPSSRVYDDSIKPVKHDLDEAKALLAEAGQPNGYTFTHTIIDTPFEIQQGEVVKPG